jgi:phosphatidylglycerol:prolipoprotein diacylglycerol transferase
MDLGIRVRYMLVMMTAVLVAFAIARRRQNKIAISSSHRSILAFAAFCGSMIGAKLPFLFDADWHGLMSGTIWLTDGKTILGGIFGGYLSVELAKYFSGIRASTGDAFALPIAVAVGIGRFGCFVGGCCFGLPTRLPWGCEFHVLNDPPGTLRHPTQLYECAFHLIAAIAIFYAERRNWIPGQRLKAYLLSYLLYRFATEWLRPEPLWIGGLTKYQWACFGLSAALIALWIRDRRCIGSIITLQPAPTESIHA